MVQDQNDWLEQLTIVPEEAGLDGLLGGKNRTSLWGIAPTAPLHLGYDSLIISQKRLVDLGLKHTVLLADYHAMLTHGYSLPEVSQRVTYYENYLRHCCGLSATFVRGSSFQTSPHYVEALYSAMSGLPISDVKQSLSKASKGTGTDKVMVSAYLYGLMQCLDCCYLDAEVVFAEHGQAKIYELLNAFPGATVSGDHAFSPSPRVNGYEKPSHFLYCPTGYDTKGRPLNESQARTRISIHESEASLKAKIDEMFAAPSSQPIPTNRVNAVLEFFKHSVFPWRTSPVVVQDVEGSLREYTAYSQFSADFQNNLLHPSDCKASLFEALRERLAGIQLALGSCLSDWVDIAKTCGVSPP